MFQNLCLHINPIPADGVIYDHRMGHPPLERSISQLSKGIFRSLMPFIQAEIWAFFEQLLLVPHGAVWCSVDI